MATPKRTTAIPDPTTFTDEWAQVQAAMVQRDYAQIDSRERIALDAQRAKDARRRWFWSGFAQVLVILIIVAAFLAIVFLLWRGAENNGDRSVIKERERTKQVEACTRLEQPSERQLCIINLGQPARQ